MKRHNLGVLILWVAYLIISFTLALYIFRGPGDEFSYTWEGVRYHLTDFQEFNFELFKILILFGIAATLAYYGLKIIFRK